MIEQEQGELTKGTIVANRFLIARKAQSGGMGAVYRARDLHSNSAVALKLMLRSNVETEDKRFTQEALVLSQLRHPGIVSYIAHGMAADGRRYLAMEWLDGQTLSQRLATQPLTLQERLRCLRAVTAALRVAHHNNIIHRDLKPSNLLLRNGVVERTTILDFGIARVAQTANCLTQTGAAIGTDQNICQLASAMAVKIARFLCARKPRIGLTDPKMGLMWDAWGEPSTTGSCRYGTVVASSVINAGVGLPQPVTRSKPLVAE